MAGEGAIDADASVCTAEERVERDRLVPAKRTNRIDGVDEVLRRVARPVQLNRPLGGAAGQRRVP